MEMQQIRYFLAVARTLNFTRAAEECNVSQPALTRAIQALEAELGGELLRRERANSHLTELGQRMLPLMQQCYESAIAAKSLAKAVKSGDVASLSIAVSRTINLALLTGPLRELARAFPGIQLRLHRGSVAEINEILKKGDAEIAIAGPMGDAWERLDQWALFDEPYELLVSRDHRLANRGGVDLRQLAGEQLLLQKEAEQAEELAARLKDTPVASASAHEVSTDHDLIALLEANFGIAITPASVSRSEGLRALPVEGLDLRRTVAIYGIAGRRRSAPANALLNLLRSADWSRLPH